MNCLRLPVSEDEEDRFGRLRLRVHQALLRRCSCPRILLEAPTSSGKTLGYLVRALDRELARPQFGTTIIVYPTNALTWDQANALHSLITDKMGRKASLAVESDEEGLRWQTEDTNAEIDLYVLNGETLAALSQEMNTSEGRALVERLRSRHAEKRIILTNPEILYYMFLYRFAKDENLISSVFHENPPNLLILDEFHLYYGYTLATMTYMLAYLKNLFEQIIFSSATPIDPERILQESVYKITATPSAEGDIIRHQTELEFQGTKGILGQEEIPKIKSLVEASYERLIDSPQQVKVLAILSSVVTCVKLHEALEENLPGKITPIHGLVPPKLRPRSKSDFKPIVIGTSAIEVGVDFDTASLIFEAHDYSSFVQRLGRGGRHGRCFTTAFIPTLYLGSMQERLPKTGEIDPADLNAVALHSLPHLSSYVDFPLSHQATPILLAILLNWTFARPAGGRKLLSGEAVEQLRKQLLDRSLVVPESLEQFRESLLMMCEDSPRGDVLGMARRMSCRSSLDSIPAFQMVNDSIQFDRISLSDLPRLDFAPVRRESLQERGIKVPWNMRLQEEFMEIKGIRQTPQYVKMALSRPERYRQVPAPLSEFRPVTEDVNLEEKIHQVVRNQPAYILYGKDDWRLPGFFTVNGEFLVVGGDAYLAWFIARASGAELSKPHLT